ncbi:hypothetical protein D3C71_2077320 [compost metagenome]
MASSMFPWRFVVMNIRPLKYSIDLRKTATTAFTSREPPRSMTNTSDSSRRRTAFHRVACAKMVARPFSTSLAVVPRFPEWIA